jgi:hypothetical protein
MYRVQKCPPMHFKRWGRLRWVLVPIAGCDRRYQVMRQLLPETRAREMTCSKCRKEATRLAAIQRSIARERAEGKT